MSKFCEKCGSKLDENTGLCPKCNSIQDNQTYYEKNNIINVNSDNNSEIKNNKKLTRHEKKTKKKIDKILSKAEKKASRTLNQKIKRFFIKLIAVLLAVIILVSGITGALVYYDVVDIPAISSIYDFFGISTKRKAEKQEETKKQPEKNSDDSESSFTIQTDDNDNSQNDENIDVGEIYYSGIDENHVAEDESDIMYSDNEILLVSKDSVLKSDIEKLAEKYNAEIVGWIEKTGDYQLKLGKSTSLDELKKIISELENNNLVESATLNYISEMSFDSDRIKYDINIGDEFRKDILNPVITGVTGIFDTKKTWGIKAINAPQAWYAMNLLKDNIEPVKVGLIDGGFDQNHEDLGFAEIFYDNGANRIESDYISSEDKNHGTHVAGTMAAKGNNTEGICGVYPYGDSRLYAASVTGSDMYTQNGNFHTSIMTEKILFAELILRNVKVINQSLGFNYYKNKFKISDGKYDYKAELEFFNDLNNFDNKIGEAKYLGDFLSRLLDKGYDFVIVSAAGNDSDTSIGHLESKYSSWTNIIENDYTDVYNRIIVVGSIGNTYDISSFSNAGDRVDIFAPGESIYSTLSDNNYGTMKGTSMAAPHVAGVAADVWSMNKYLTGSDVKKIICEQINDNSHKDSNGKVDYPMVDASKSVREAYNLLASSGKVTKEPENGGVLGWVYESDEETPIEDAKITPYLQNSNDVVDNVEVTTDEYGHFELIIPSGNYTLHINKEGYKEKEIEVTVKKGEVNYLSEDDSELIILEKDYDSQNAITHPSSSERDIVLVLDTSGSMDGMPLDETKKAATKFVDTILKEDASIGIVNYDIESNIASDFSNNKNSLDNVINDIEAGGSTNIEAGLRSADEMLEKSSAEKKIIVLMSDGEPNHGLVDDELVEYADELKEKGIYIYTLGFFESVDDKTNAQALMEELANDGCHYEVSDADSLVFFFGDIADQINGQKYIYVRIACPVDVSVTYDGETLNSSESDLNTRTKFGTLTFEDSDSQNKDDNNRDTDDEDKSDDNETEDDEDDKVKILRLKEGEDYDIKIEGTGRGRMNYSIGFMDENGEYSDFRRFNDIRITRRTKIDTVAEVSDKTVLKVDKDGDGKYDVTYQASANGYGEIVDYTYIIYIAVCLIVLVALVIFILVIKRKVSKNKTVKNIH